MPILRNAARQIFALNFFPANLFSAILLSASVLTLPPASNADDKSDVHSKVPDSKNQIMKLTDSGVVPRELHMKKEDSIVFFLNDSSDSLATLSVDFKKRTTHCASSNFKIRDDGLVTSVRPVEPRNFASVCFHDTGEYPVVVYGLKKAQAVQAKIVVE